MTHKVADIKDITLKIDKNHSVVVDIDGNKMVDKNVFFRLYQKNCIFQTILEKIGTL